MIQPHTGREEPATPRDRNSDHIIRIDEISGPGIKIELRKDPAEQTDLPTVATIPSSNQTNVLTEPNRTEVDGAVIGTDADPLQGGEELWLLRIGPQWSKDVVLREGLQRRGTSVTGRDRPNSFIAAVHPARFFTQGWMRR